MASADHLHLLTPGYRATADKLFAEIMRHYDPLPGHGAPWLMLFPTIDFLLFFTVVAAAMVPLRHRHQARKRVLVLASYVFYAQWNWRFCLLLAFSSVVTFAAGRLIAASTADAVRNASSSPPSPSTSASSARSNTSTSSSDRSTPWPTASA